MVVANNVQTRSDGVDNQVNPWSRRAGGPCPCRCRRSQQRLPQRESRPKQTELSSLEFPFLSRPAIHTSCLAAPLVAPLNPMVHRLRRQWGTSKGTVSLGTQLLLPRGRRRCDLRGNRRYRLWRIIFMHGGCHPVSSRLHEPFPKFWGVFCHSCQAHAFARVVYAILIGHLHSRT